MKFWINFFQKKKMHSSLFDSPDVATMRGDIHLTPTPPSAPARMDVDVGRPLTRSSTSAVKKTAAFTTSPMSVLLQPLTPASATSFTSPGGSPETRRRILSDEEDDGDECGDAYERERRGEPRTPRSGNGKMMNSSSVFAEELDRAAREPWAAPVGGAFDAAPRARDHRVWIVGGQRRGARIWMRWGLIFVGRRSARTPRTSRCFACLDETSESHPWVVVGGCLGRSDAREVKICIERDRMASVGAGARGGR